VPTDWSLARNRAIVIKKGRLSAGFVAAVVCGVAFFSLAAHAQSGERRVLPGHVPAAVTRLRLQPASSLPATTRLDLSIGLPLRNEPALNELLAQLYDPRSTNFHKFLTPEQFTEKFGPTMQDYQAVIQFAESNGLAVADTHPNRVVVDVEGSVSNIDRAFQTTLRRYHHPTEARDFFAPDTAPSVPANLSVVTVEGLSDYQLPKPLLHKIDPQKIQPLGGSGPGGGYAGKDFRNAYAPGTALNGAGQSVGLLEFSSYYAADITNYENTVGMSPYVPLSNVVVGRRTPGTANNNEVALDIEMAISMAPGLSRVIVYETSSGASSILSRMANDNQAKQLSSSWTWGGGPSTTIDNIFKQMAAQGQSYFQASGDNDAYTGSQLLDSGSNSPVDSTNITCVGGTSLTMNNAGDYWLAETVWNWNNNGQPNVGSGGGISTYYTIPWWQTNVSMTANSGSTVWRNIPDVALTADNVFVVYDNGSSGSFGGTSCAAPLWAGFCALVNQQSVAASGTTVGFLNPALYAIANGANYANCFHDVIMGNNVGTGTPGLFYAVAGYDLCTGLGTPNGTNLINALAPLPTLPRFAAQPSSQIATNGANVTFTASVLGQAPLAFQWLFNGAGLRDGGNISGSAGNTLNITAATTNNSGNYSLVVSNSFGSVTSRVATLSVGFAPAFSSQPASLAVFSGSTAVISATVGGSSPLFYQWRKNGFLLANGGNVSGVTSNVLTFTAATTNNSGNYTLTVTNIFGAATSHVATLTVNLISPVMAVTSSKNPSGFKDPLIFTASLTPTNAAGIIQFLTNGTPFDVEPLLAGVAVSTNPALAELPRGTDLITAIYSGDANDLPVTNTFAQIVTNHPPAAVDVFYDRLAGYPLNIAVADLATNWSDADGDTVSLDGIGVSTNGVTVTNDAGTLVYYGTNDVDDELVCTISDGWGGTNVQTVYVDIVLTNTTPSIIGLGNGSDGGVTLSLAGAPGYTYVLEATSNLLWPGGWLPLSTNTLGTNGVWTFTDTRATNNPVQFYRLILTP
jgi:subtilase family serine protease